MRILHTSDLHLGKNLYDFSLLDDQRAMLGFLLEIIEREEIEAVVIAGDVFDRPVPSAEAVRLYDDFLTKAVGGLGVPVIAVAGNHDSATRLEFGSALYRAGGYYVFGPARQPQQPVVLRDGFGDVWFHPVPWLHPAEARAIFPDEGIKTFDDAYRVLLESRAADIDRNKRNVAVAHGFFAPLGAKNQSEREMLTSESEISVGGMDIADSGYFSAFNYTALGHLHAPQRAGGETVRYSGSPLKYSLSEENQRKSCVIATIGEDGETDVRTIEIPATHDVRSVTGSFDELMEPSFHPNKQFNDYVFANVTDSGILYPMEKLRTLFPNLLGLRFITPEADFRPPEISSGPRLTTLELFLRFYKDAKSADMPQDRLDYLYDVMQGWREKDE